MQYTIKWNLQIVTIMVSSLMNRRPCPFSTTSSPPRHLCALRVGVYPELLGALTFPDLFLSPFNLELSAKGPVEVPASLPFHSRHLSLTTRHFCTNHETLLVPKSFTIRTSKI